jgi:hypothetical protein
VPQDERVGFLESLLGGFFRLALRILDRREMQQHTTVKKIPSGADFLDPGENDWFRVVKHYFIGIGVELAIGISGSGRGTAKRIRESGGHD